MPRRRYSGSTSISISAVRVPATGSGRKTARATTRPSARATSRRFGSSGLRHSGSSSAAVYTKSRWPVMPAATSPATSIAAAKSAPSAPSRVEGIGSSAIWTSVIGAPTAVPCLDSHTIPGAEEIRPPLVEPPRWASPSVGRSSAGRARRWSSPRGRACRDPPCALTCALRRTFCRHAARATPIRGVSTESPVLRTATWSSHPAGRALRWSSPPLVEPLRWASHPLAVPPSSPPLGEPPRWSGLSRPAVRSGVCAPQDFLSTRRAGDADPRRVGRKSCVTYSHLVESPCGASPHGSSPPLSSRRRQPQPPQHQPPAATASRRPPAAAAAGSSARQHGRRHPVKYRSPSICPAN